MKNKAVIALGAAEDADHAASIEAAAREGAGRLLAALEEIGFETKFSTDEQGLVSLVFEWDQDSLTRLRTRDSGRRKVSLPEDSPLRGMTASQAAAWLEERGEKEGMAALGVSRSSYYRRRRAATEAASELPDAPFEG